MQIETVLTKRDCYGIQVPSGEIVNIPEGTMVQITQALGGSYTINYNGNLIRIDGDDADALGKERQTVEFSGGGEHGIQESDIWEVLKTCYDPEIPVNIVELGLIYECRIDKMEDDKNHVYIRMTLTAPGCGMGTVLAKEVEQKIAKVPNVDNVTVELTFDPPWDQSMLSDVAKVHLGLL